MKKLSEIIERVFVPCAYLKKCRARKYQKDKEDRHESLNRMLVEFCDFRGIGESFTHLGITMVVRSHIAADIDMDCGARYSLCVECDYADRNGVIRTHIFYYKDLASLRLANDEQNERETK